MLSFFFLIDLKYVFLIKVKKNIGQGTIKIKKKKSIRFNTIYIYFAITHQKYICC